MQGQSEGIEYDTPKKMIFRGSQCRHIRQNILEVKKVMRQNWTVYNDKGDHSSRRYTPHTHISNIESTRVYVKQLLTSLKGAIDHNTIVEDFNTQLTLADSSSRQNSTVIQWS